MLRQVGDGRWADFALKRSSPAQLVLKTDGMAFAVTAALKPHVLNTPYMACFTLTHFVVRQVGDGRWADFALKRSSPAQLVLKTDGMAFAVTAAVTRAPGPYARTRLVTLLPRFVLLNTTPFDLLVGQDGHEVNIETYSHRVICVYISGSIPTCYEQALVSLQLKTSVDAEGGRTFAVIIEGG